MNDIKHTPGPWGVKEHRRIVSVGWEIRAKHDGCAVAFVLGDKSPELRENARRIVACVNACEGIPTEDLEQAQTTQRENLTRFGLACQQRDELLDALKDACEWLDSCPLGDAPREALIVYRAIIARCGGHE